MGICNLNSLLQWFLVVNLAANAHTIDYKARNAGGLSTGETIRAVRQELYNAQFLERDTDLSGSLALDTSWNEAVLLNLALEEKFDEANVTVTGGVQVICKKCYIKGVARAELNIASDFDAGEAVSQTLGDIRDNVENFTDTVEDYVADYAKGVIKNFKDGIDLEDFALPTFPFDFGDIELPAMPEVNLHFGFDDLELYLELNAKLSLGATYKLNLYKSITPVGIAITEKLDLGILFTMDLILSVEGEIDITSGFHIRVEDDFQINIALFSEDISEIVFNGGKFEFLPVTIESAGVVFKADIRLGVHAGFKLTTPTFPEVKLFDKTLKPPSVGGGIEVGIFANLADFVTNVTAGTKEDDCAVEVVQSYQLALGAAAGMTVHLNTHTWGPVAATTTAIWYTEMDVVCANAPTARAIEPPLVTARPLMGRQEELSTTTTVTKITYTGVDCISQGLVNCPASLETTTRSVETKTLTTSVQPGAEVVWPEPTTGGVAEIVEFGANAQELTATSGAPKSFVPPPPPPTSTSTQSEGKSKAQSENEDENDEDEKDGKAGGLSKAAIIGISVGVGVPALIALMAGSLLLWRRKKYVPIPEPQSIPLVAESHQQEDYEVFSDKPSNTGIRDRDRESHS